MCLSKQDSQFVTSERKLYTYFLTCVSVQCGADVQSLNNQGLTALDIVNMYTDPRSAGLMKQVLQGDYISSVLFLCVFILGILCLHS